jgi:DNA-binding MurR/RpiR family transcriptional regulator
MIEMKLSKKEQRLADYYIECSEKGTNPTIGEICKAVKTTPFTLLGKTQPSLRNKLNLH